MPRKDLKHYWPDRVQERNSRNLKLSIQEQEENMRALYKHSFEEIKAQLYEVMHKIEEDAFKDGIMINDAYRNKRYWELINYIKENLTALGSAENLLIEQELIDMYEKTQKMIESIAPDKPLGVQYLNTNAIDVKHVVHQSWCLDGKEFSDRIWEHKEKLLERLNKSITDFMVQGKGAYQIALKLQEDMGVAEYCAYRIVRTETAHMQNKATTDKYRDMGFTHGKFLGRDCCDMCKDRNGKTYTLDELETLIPQHPNCTCSYILIPQERK